MNMLRTYYGGQECLQDVYDSANLDERQDTVFAAWLLNHSNQQPLRWSVHLYSATKWIPISRSDKHWSQSILNSKRKRLSLSWERPGTNSHENDPQGLPISQVPKSSSMGWRWKGGQQYSSLRASLCGKMAWSRIGNIIPLTEAAVCCLVRGSGAQDHGGHHGISSGEESESESNSSRLAARVSHERSLFSG